MHLDQLLLKHMEAILREWFQGILDTYPPETARLLKRESNQFANPVGHTVYYGLKGLLEEFFRGPRSEDEKLATLLDNIIRIRAVQDFAASEAVQFVFLLKPIVRRTLDEPLDEGKISYEDLLAFNRRVDDLALLAFNVYMRSRERLYEVRLTEYKNSTNRLLQQANRILGNRPGQGSESEDETT